MAKIKLVYDPKVSLEEVKNAYIVLAMDHFEGNKTRAAGCLGITQRTLYNMLDRLQVKWERTPWVKGLWASKIEPWTVSVDPIRNLGPLPSDMYDLDRLPRQNTGENA